MADVSNVSLTGDVSVDIKKAKGRPRRARPGKDARTDGTAGTEAVTGDVSQNEAGDAAASGQAKDGKTRRKRKETGLTAEPKTAAPEAAAAATADISAAQENHVRRSRKGKARELKHLTAEEQGVSSKLPFLRLSEPLGKSARLPPVFSHDGRFCFVAAASSVMIYLVSSSQMLASLDLPALSSTSSGRKSSLNQPNNQITSVFVNPSNNLQVITTSLDGIVRIWDYLEGRVLYSADMGGAIACAAIVSRDSTAYQSTPLRESLFLAVNRGSTETDGPATPADPPTSVVFCVSLKRSEISKPVRLGKCKDAVGMSVSSDGKSVVVIGRKKIHIAQIAESSKKTIVSVAPFISFEGLASTTYMRNVTFTTVVCHPTASYFATGDTRGSIRLWYILTEESLNNLRAASEKANGSEKGKANIVPSAAMSVLHWHAHAVSSLAFTPNGAYLLSGGEEAVLVVWQIESRHKEFVPRIGAPIEALNIINGQSGQQEFVARLKDGTIAFLGAGTLKVVRTIAGVKSIEQFATAKQASNLPLAIEPLTNRLVFQASHPSTIQFYSASQDMHVYEQDISPSNRVSRTDERPIVPVRVEHIAFSASAPPSSALVPLSENEQKHPLGPIAAAAFAAEATGTVWMATFDTWQDREYSRESHLKFWMGFPSHKPGYGLVSRIDNPHGQERVTSMSFSSVPPSPSISSSSLDTAAATGNGVGKLCTTSLDGTIKLWSYRIPEEALKARSHKKTKHTATPIGIWQCLYSLSYRSLPAVLSAFSKDGSLIAIVHRHDRDGASRKKEKSDDDDDDAPRVRQGDKVTLWNADNGNLVKAFNVTEEEVGLVSSITFAGAQGTRLIAGGDKGHVVWDLLTCEEVASLPIPASKILTSPDTSSDYYIAVSSKTATTLSLSDSNFSSVEALPFALSQLAAYPTDPVKVSSDSVSIPLIASIAKTGQVALLGPESALRKVRPSAFESAANLQAALNSKTVDGEELRPVRLFDELFGPSALSAAAAPSTSTSTYTMASLGAGPALPTGKRDIFDEIPSHKLPSLSELWRGLLSDKLKPLGEASSSTSTKLEHGRRIVKNEDDDSDDDDGDTSMDVDQYNHAAAADDQENVKEEEDEDNLVPNEELQYENLPEEELIKIFKECMPSVPSTGTNASPSKGGSSGIPSDRLAGKSAKDKSKKKRKSLLGSMV
ncbi:WD40 repeat-like protein [Cystobasidium minutum MCA 4210]|uniref:WD40 repeat-like protein n=1 Tax=Cystobasidium minutum MCA 4210 TaxID=1397322 RepID=UPI0034CFD5DA|eukprot:jgi/Rhomi1/168718/fgenesh1_kg.3_\